MSTVVLYCWCHSDSASVLLYFTLVADTSTDDNCQVVQESVIQSMGADVQDIANMKNPDTSVMSEENDPSYDPQLTSTMADECITRARSRHSSPDDGVNSTSNGDVQPESRTDPDSGLSHDVSVYDPGLAATMAEEDPVRHRRRDAATLREYPKSEQQVCCIAHIHVIHKRAIFIKR